MAVLVIDNLTNGSQLWSYDLRVYDSDPHKSSLDMALGGSGLPRADWRLSEALGRVPQRQAPAHGKTRVEFEWPYVTAHGRAVAGRTYYMTLIASALPDHVGTTISSATVHITQHP